MCRSSPDLLSVTQVCNHNKNMYSTDGCVIQHIGCAILIHYLPFVKLYTFKFVYFLKLI